MAFFHWVQRQWKGKNSLENAASPHYRHCLCAVLPPCWSMKPSEAANDTVESERARALAQQHNNDK